MARSDRLINLIQILRDGQLHRGADLALALGVSLRTIYRDMEALALSGLPVAGERGTGYQITHAITLPPLNLSKTELEALHVGLSIVGGEADGELQEAAQSLSAKIDAVLPEDRTAAPTGWGFAVYPFADAAQGFQHMPALRGAIRARQKVRIDYGTSALRVIRPLELDYWGRVWTVTAWCETIADFDVFRIDQITQIAALPAVFTDEPGKRLQDYLDRLDPPRGNT